MEIIRELEGRARGPYAGCIGWLGLDKDSVNLDTGITIRSMPNLLVVPPSLEGAGRKLLKNEFNAAGATNEWFGAADLLSVPYLA